MIRLSMLAWFIFLAFLGVGVFHLKYTVQAQEKELRKIRADISRNLDVIHVLKAEWSYLNDPTRLADLTRRHIDLAPITATQIIDITKIPFRPSENGVIANVESKGDLPILTEQPGYLPEDRELIQHVFTGIGQ